MNDTMPALQAHTMKPRNPAPGRCPQRGVLAILFGLTLVLLIGFIGLAIDLGRFFVIKSELQNAMDACALAAAAQLGPGVMDVAMQARAETFARNVGARNKVNFRSTGPDPIVITLSEISGTAKFAKCECTLTDLPIYFMKILVPAGGGTQSIRAVAVAAQYASPAAPVLTQ